MNDKPLRIIFMGTPEFAVPSLQALIDNKEKVVAVVCQPDRPKGRGRKLTPPPVKVLAQEAGLTVLQPEKVRTQAWLDELKSYDPDLILVAAYGRILTKEVLELPPLGCINVHGSLLPKHRGAAPIQWSILKGDAATGITIMNMDEGMDTGDILLRSRLPIDDQETSGSLAVKMAERGGSLLIKALNLLRSGELLPQVQDHSQATLAPPLKKEDGKIDWSKSARHISCQIRGLDPWPTASTVLNGKRLRLFKPHVFERPCQETAGTIVRAEDDGLLIATGNGYLLVQEVQKEGSRRMAVADFLRGHQDLKDTVLGDL